MPADTQTPTFTTLNNTLHISTPQVEMRVRWQPEPLAEERITGSLQWRQCWPEFRLVRPLGPQPMLDATALDLPLRGKAVERESAKAAAFAAFRALIPERQVVLAERFGSHQWPLLVLLNAKVEACELATNNPILAYCLANHAGFRGTLQETAAGYAIMHCTDRQRDILGWLGFPDTGATARLFRKIRPEAVSPILMRLLRHTLKTDAHAAGLLAHLPSINAGVLGLVINRHLTGLVSSKLLLEVAANEDDLVMGQTPDRLLMALAILRELKRKLPETTLKTLAQVDRLLHDCDALYLEHLRQVQAQQVIAAQAEADEQRRRRRTGAARRRAEARNLQIQRECRERKSKPFPKPPLPATVDFVPLTTREMLQEEGQAQGNCVGTYAFSVLAEHVYIYRVLNPERATLSIARGADGGWWRFELQTANHGRPSVNTVRHVDQWLAAHGLSA